MPYITSDRRKKIDEWGELPHLIETLKENTGNGKENSGDVTYVIYKILVKIYGEGNFEIRSNALKVLSSVEDEFKVNIMQPYEKKKKEINGDV
jgi:hypothetical protein